MAKKGPAVQLQAEINNDEEWEKLLEKEGLIVVDIYSDWSGPCAAMTANLKKLKLEVGGDNLQLAIAKCDGITALERFRYKSEPTWMFISNGKMVNLMFGANSPKLMNLIIDELKKDALVREGAAELVGIEVTDLAPEEQVRFDVIKAIEDEAIRIETEKREQEILERRTAVAEVVIQNLPKFGVIIVFPQAKDIVKSALADLWEPAGLVIHQTEKPRFTEEIVEELLYFAETTFSEIDIVNLLSEQTLAYVVKPTDMDGFSANIDEVVTQFVYGSSMCPPGSPDSPAQSLIAYVPVPKEVASEGLREPEPLHALVLPSNPSLSAFNTSQAAMQSRKSIKSKEELRSQLEMLSKTMVHSKSMLPGGEESVASIKEGTLEVTGLWVPPNAQTRATAIKLLFPRVYDPIALPEPIPTPPYIAIVFEAYKRKELADLMAEYESEIMHYGFFTDENPDTAELVAKTIQKYEKARATGSSFDQKLVIQLSKKRSEAWCAFSQLGPVFMSHNTVEGAVQCNKFFPEGYEEPDEDEDEVVEVKKSKKGKKGKKPKEPTTPSQEDLLDAEDASDDQLLEEDEPEGEGEGEAEGEGEEEEGEDVDKATSPMPEE